MQGRALADLTKVGLGLNLDFFNAPISSDMSIGSAYLAKRLFTLCRLLRPMRNTLRACLKMSTRSRAFLRHIGHGSDPIERH